MLALDVGTAHVKAALLDRVGEAHRFIARGAAPQIASISTGGSLRSSVSAALEDLESVSGRRVASSEGDIVIPETLGTGVDAAAGVVSILGSLEVAVASLREDTAMQYAEGALRATPSRITARISGKQMAARGQAMQEFAATLRDSRPKVILLVGGNDQKPDRSVVGMAEALAVAVSLIRPQERQTLLYAGPSSLRPSITAAVAERMPLNMVDNVSPDDRTPQLGPLRRELDLLYLSLLGDAREGMREVWRWCQGRVCTVGQAMLRVYSRPDLDVLAADVGASYTTLVRTGQGQVLVQPDCGLGQGAKALLERRGTEKVRRWLEGEVAETVVGDFALNRGLRPWSRAATADEMDLELALTREALTEARESAAQAWPEARAFPAPLPPKVDMVVGGGGVLSRTRSLARAAAALLDGLQPVGVCRLALDFDGLATALGALAEVNSTAVLSVLERDGVLVLGTVIAPVGQGRPGAEAVRVTLTAPDGEKTEVKASAGEIVRLPLPAGVRATAIIQPARGYDVGGGGSGQGLEAEVEGGPLGVIVDARGRPLPDPAQMPNRSESVRRWLAGLGE